MMMSAKAPYNFVPLNEKIIKSDMELEDIQSFDNIIESLHSGFIDIEIEARTPIYIRNTKSSKENASDSDKEHYEDFFSPGGKYKIPGSSFRGLLRSFIETISFGKFENFDDRTLYYRSINHPLYKTKMIGYDRTLGAFVKVHSGLLRKEGTDWVIYPSKKGPMEKNTQFYRVNFNSVSRELKCNPSIRLKEFDFIPVDFEPVQQRTNPQNHRFPLYYALVTKVNKMSNPTSPGCLNGYLISTGNLGNKKHMHWIINTPDFSKKIKVEDEVRINYEKDTSRDERSDLSCLLKKYPNGVPCFFLLENSKITALGLTAYFRLPYNKSIKDHVSSNKSNNIADNDMTEAIFGKVDENSENTIASRIFVEDFNLIKDDKQKLHSENESKTPKVLGGPKPTSYQLYLEQEHNSQPPKDWSRDNKIRGYKYYWHKDVTSTSDWSEQNPGHLNVHAEKIKPLAPGNKFKGRIRFENLSDIELGAILFTLNLPSNCLLKIGLAKPYGLGSIQLSNIILTFKNPKDRYTKLFDPTMQNWEKGLIEESNQKKYWDKFCIYILQNLGLWNQGTNKNADPKEVFWSLPRMKELRCLLNWENTKINNWNGKTEYMTLNCPEYRNKEILPKASDVAK